MEPSPCRETGRAVGLFWQFFKFGFYTFGGGWSIVAQIQKTYVQKRGWLTDTDLLDITSVGRSLPGLMVGNVGYLFGYHVAGFPGALCCLLGLTLPSLIILTAVTWAYTLVQSNVYFLRAMAGVRAAVVPIILASALSLRKAALAEKGSWIFLLLAFALSFFLNVSPVLIVLLCGALGLAMCALRGKKGDGNGPA